MARFYSFAGMADSLTLAQMQAFKTQAVAAHRALKALEAIATGPEPLSAYIGQAFSNIVEEIENLSCSLDSRIEDVKECSKTLTYNDVNVVMNNRV